MVRQPENQKKKKNMQRPEMASFIGYRNKGPSGQGTVGERDDTSVFPSDVGLLQNKTEYTVLSYCSEIPDSASPNEAHLLSPCISCLALSHLQGFNVVR